MTPKLLIIPDAHAEPNYDNNRFTWLGNLIFEEKPDIIVTGSIWHHCRRTTKVRSRLRAGGTSKMLLLVSMRLKRLGRLRSSGISNAQRITKHNTTPIVS